MKSVNSGGAEVERGNWTGVKSVNSGGAEVERGNWTGVKSVNSGGAEVERGDWTGVNSGGDKYFSNVHCLPGPSQKRLLAL